MDKFSRREFFNLSVALSMALPTYAYAKRHENDDRRRTFPNTILALKRAFKAETIAHKHYLGFIDKALDEKYPNIAYMFSAFSCSEKIHADNYQRMLRQLGNDIDPVHINIQVLDTKSNLQQAAEKELEKIDIFYPEVLKKIGPESYEEAIVNCMYSWKSHRQHEEKVKEIQKYAKFFFGSVASRIEDMKFNFHVCKICGSTIDEVPHSPCEICNRSMSHYMKVNRPV